MIRRYLLLFICFICGFSYSTETFDTLAKKSSDFSKQISFPTINNRIEAIAGNNIKKKQLIAEHANSVRPIIDARVIQLIKDFLSYKKRFGSQIEQKFYKRFEIYSFIDRLLTCRPMMFMLQEDLYLLRDGSRGSGGFETIGSTKQKENLLLEKYLSYDEIEIAALFGVSTPTFFINNGERNNLGRIGVSGTYQESGIYTGVVGARFEKPNFMEWKYIVITPEQNTSSNGYGLYNSGIKYKLLGIWSEFYGERFPTFEEARADTRGNYIKLEKDLYFNVPVYKKRLEMVVKPFLLDANERAKEKHTKAYCHIVGIGLGVWQLSPIQAKLMFEVYIELLSKYTLDNISDIDFSWFPKLNILSDRANNLYTSIDNTFELGTVQDGQIIKTKNNRIKLHFSKRNPADRLVGHDANKLLVAMYAWDGNAYAGNEYWAGQLAASGDPAAACCSTIPELQNPLINSNVSSKKLFVS